MIYASINPEKFFESEKGAKLMQVTLVLYFYYFTINLLCHFQKYKHLLLLT
jgi:hypothetical protein